MAWSNPSWNQPIGQAKPQPKKTPRTWIWVVAGLVVVVAVSLYFILSPSAEGPKPEPKATKPKAVKTPKPEVKREAPKPAVEAPKPAKSEPAKEEYVKKPGQMQLPDGKILTFPAPKEGETRKVYAYGHLYECDHLGNWKDVSKRQLFKTAFEGNLMALASENGSFIPAFLTGLDEDAVRQMLIKPYEPIGDETEEELAALKRYDDVRATALAYMAEGGKFDDFVNNIANFEKKQRETRATCMREVMTLWKQGKIAEAKEMAQAAKVLNEREGFKPIKFPPHVQADFDKLPEVAPANVPPTQGNNQ